MAANWVALLFVAFVIVVAPSAAQPMRSIRAFGVNQIPLLDQRLPPWIYAEHRPFYGPLGAYLTTLLEGCGQNLTFTFTNWTSSGRMAEYDVLLGDTEIAFPVSRLYRTSLTTVAREAGGAYFLPVIESPGTLVFLHKRFVPTTLDQALLTKAVGTTLVVVLSIALGGGALLWLLERLTETDNPDLKGSFASGIFTSFYWAVVSMTTVGYGDITPRSRQARAFAFFFLLSGITMMAVMQSSVISGIVSTRDVIASQQRRATDILNGLNVGVVQSSVEEWRMRSRGAIVTLFDNIEAGMAALRDDTNPLQAFAVDQLAAAVIYNTLGSANVRPSGTISDPVIYGFVLDEALALRPSTLLHSGVNMSLIYCLDTLIRAGPIHYSRLIYFRGLDAYLQFSVNEDERDQEEQAQVANDAMAKAALGFPITTVALVVMAAVFNHGWSIHGKRFQHLTSWLSVNK